MNTFKLLALLTIVSGSIYALPTLKLDKFHRWERKTTCGELVRIKYLRQHRQYLWRVFRGRVLVEYGNAFTLAQADIAAGKVVCE